MGNTALLKNSFIDAINVKYCATCTTSYRASFEGMFFHIFSKSIRFRENLKEILKRCSIKSYLRHYFCFNNWHVVWYSPNTKQSSFCWTPFLLFIITIARYSLKGGKMVRKKIRGLGNNIHIVFVGWNTIHVI